MTKRCMDCRSYRPHENEPNVGFCHRYPPSFHTNGLGQSTGTFVPVHPERGWCDEFKAKPNKGRGKGLRT